MLSTSFAQSSRRKVLELYLNRREYKFKQPGYQMTRRHVLDHIASIMEQRVASSMLKISQGWPVRESSLLFREQNYGKRRW